MSGALDEQERLCHEMLRMLREAYEKQAEPYIQQLSNIYAIRSPSWTIPVAEAAFLTEEKE